MGCARDGAPLDAAPAHAGRQPIQLIQLIQL